MRETIDEFLKGAVAAAVIAAGFCGAARATEVARYNVVWDSPSKDASGVMPLGNGDIAAGVYAIENGDLYLLLAKNDAYTYQPVARGDRKPLLGQIRQMNHLSPPCRPWRNS